MRRVWRLFEGTGLITAVGTAFLALGILFAGLTVASPNGWQWFSARSIHGQENTGVVIYRYHGEVYTIDDTTSLRTGPRLLWINPSDPAQAALHIEVAQISDSLFVAVPLVIAAGLMGAGFRRRHQRKVRDRGDGPEPAAGFGSGIDSAVIAGIVAKRRQNRL